MPVDGTLSHNDDVEARAPVSSLVRNKGEVVMRRPVHRAQRWGVKGAAVPVPRSAADKGDPPSHPLEGTQE